MKKILKVLAVCTLLVSCVTLSACGNKVDNKETTEKFVKVLFELPNESKVDENGVSEAVKEFTGENEFNSLTSLNSYNETAADLELTTKVKDVKIEEVTETNFYFEAIVEVSGEDGTSEEEVKGSIQFDEDGNINFVKIIKAPESL